MRQTYLVTYDISDPKRLRAVFQIMRGWGDHLQLSVFRCDLDARELVEVRAALTAEIDHDEDQVLFVDVGPADGRALSSFTTLGRPPKAVVSVAIVV
ncbi:MAG: CRISPR-associated endonuclease Cas2 [Polyangiaceae bacterium]